MSFAIEQSQDQHKRLEVKASNLNVSCEQIALVVGQVQLTEGEERCRTLLDRIIINNRKFCDQPTNWTTDVGRYPEVP